MKPRRAKGSLVALPSEEELFQQIMLTANVVWRKQLARKTIDRWLSNFTGGVHSREYERRRALWLLANFVYYNEQEVRNLCGLLFRQFLRQHLLDKNTPAGQNVSINVGSILAGSRFLWR